MALYINTNVGSLLAQKNLGLVNQDLQQNQERLSTGLRINSAADDAAGLSISNRMTAQIRGMNQAVRNANDGISMLQNAESGLSEISNILQRLRELAVQASNAGTPSDRADMNQEYQQMLSELDRISQVTEFNGLKPLDGSQGETTFQVGANTASINKINVDLGTSMLSKDIGSSQEFGGTLSLDNATGAGLNLENPEIQIKHSDVTQFQQLNTENYAETTVAGTGAFGTESNQTSTGKTDTSAYAVAQAINNNDNLNIAAFAKNEQNSIQESLAGEITNNGGGSATDARVTATAQGTYTLSINGVEILNNYQKSVTATAVNSVTQTTTTATVSLTALPVVGAINARSQTLGVTAQTTDDGGIKLTNLEGGDIFVREQVQGNFTSGSGNANGFFVRTANAAAASQIFRGEVELEGKSAFTVQDTSTDDEEFLNTALTGGSGMQFAAPNQSQFLNSTDVTTVSNAQKAVNRIDQAITDLNQFEATIGASINRFDSSIRNLNNAVQSTTEARSRIQDADIAKEASEMTQNNVRRQAATAVLAQSNQNPQLALQLLGG